MTQLTYLGKNFSARFGDNFFDVNINDAYVDGMRCCDYHAVFKVTVRRGKRSWDIKKRFSDFFLLRSTTAGHEEINFPPKTYFPCIETEFIEERRVLLQEYMDQLLTAMSRDNSIKSDSDIAGFLCLSEDAKTPIQL